MPIDFGILNAKAPEAHEVAKIPYQASQPSSIDSLAGGIAEGLKSGVNMATQLQRNKEDAQLMPGILKQQQDKTAQADMDVTDRQNKAAADLQVSKAFQQSWQAGMAQLKQSNPGGYLQVQQQQANTAKTMADVAGKMTDNSKKSLDLFNSQAANAALLAQHASAAEAKQPGAGEQVYQQGLKMLGPTLSSALPPHYDESTHLALLGVGGDAMHQQAQAQFDKNATPGMKAANRIGELTDKVNAGTISGGEKAELSTLLANNAPKDSSAKNPFDNALAGQSAKMVTQMDTQSQALDIVHDDAKDALEILNKIPAGYVGPVVDYLKMNGMNTEVQKLQKLTAGIPIAVKAMYGVSPGNRLTATELQQLNKASGSTAINKEALGWVLNRIIPQTEGIMHDNWQKTDSIYKNASPKIYNNWKESHPEPEGTNFSQIKAPGQNSTTEAPKVPDGRVVVYDKTGKVAGHIPNDPDQIKQAESAGYMTSKPETK